MNTFPFEQEIYQTTFPSGDYVVHHHTAIGYGQGHPHGHSQGYAQGHGHSGPSTGYDYAPVYYPHTAYGPPKDGK